MSKTKETLLFNLMFQILKNQTDSINGVLTHELYDESNQLKKDCLAFINKSVEPCKTQTTKEDSFKTKSEDLLIYWKEHGLIDHNKVDGFINGIKVGVKNSSFKELKKAIKRYSNVLFDEKSILTQRWTIGEFCRKHYQSFETEAQIKAKYYWGKNGYKSTQQSIISIEEAKHAFNS
jgi:hypothetical protein